MGSVCDRGHSEQIQGVTLDSQVTGRQSGQWHKWLHQEGNKVAAVGAGLSLGGQRASVRILCWVPSVRKDWVEKVSVFSFYSAACSGAFSERKFGGSDGFVLLRFLMLSPNDGV